MAVEHSSSRAMRTQCARQDLPQRKRLAPNVVCMFSDERPPVHQTRHKGRHPKAVTSIAKARERKWTENPDEGSFYLPSDKAEVVSFLRDVLDEVRDDDEVRGIVMVICRDSVPSIRFKTAGSFDRQPERLVDSLNRVSKAIAERI